MRKRLLLILVSVLVALTAVVPASAYWKSDGFRYTFENGEVTILGYDGKETDVTIPASFDGSPVTAIASYAFYENSTLTGVTIPEGVTKIGAYAFEYCDSLESVTLPQSLKMVESSAFAGCTALRGVYITDVAAWCAVFFGGTQTNPTSFAHGLYLNGTLVRRLVIPEGVTSVGGCAFENCSSIESVSLPKSLKEIGTCAFMGCTSLSSVNIPDGVTTVGDGAFYRCSSLYSVTVPKSVTRILIGAFDSCELLKLRYAGSAEDWNKISFDEYDETTKDLPAEFNYVPPAIEKGDANGDGKINAKDVTAIMKYLVGFSDGLDESAADFNGDGKINAKDVTALMKAIVTQA